MAMQIHKREMDIRRWWPPRYTEVVLFLTLLAFGLRLYRLSFQPLWGDEGWSFYFAGLRLPEMIERTAQDIHPPLYYALLHSWLGVTGSTPETARLLSVIMGTLTVGVIWRVGNLLHNQRAALLASALTALAPLAVYYSQEVRMYGMVTLLSVSSSYFLVRLVFSTSWSANRESSFAGRQISRRNKWLWLGYVLTTAAALYTMYYALFLLLAQTLWLGISLLRERFAHRASQWRYSGGVVGNAPIPWRRVASAMATAGVLYAPWVAYVAQQLVNYVQGKRVAEAYVPLNAAQYFSAHLAAFSIGHTSEALDLFRWATLGFGALALLGLLYGMAQRRYLLSTVLLLCCLLVPLGGGFIINLAYPFTPRYFERTLLLVAPVWWLLVSEGLDWLWRRSRVVFISTGVLLLGLLSASLIDFYTVPRYRDEDYRPLLRYVRTHSSTQDVILASYQWQLGLYQAYLPSPHPRFFVVPGWGKSWADDPQRMRADLIELMNEHPRLWFPAYQVLGRLWETRVEEILNRIAFPTQVDWNLPGTKLILYGRGGTLREVIPILAQSAQPGVANFANALVLERVQVGSEPLESGRGVLPVVLIWRKEKELTDVSKELRVALRLIDSTGQRWAGRDSRPMGGLGSFHLMREGETLIDRHGVLIPAGTPPGEYQLRLGIVREQDERPLDVLDEQDQPQGSEVILGNVRVVLPTEPLSPEALPVQHPLQVDFGEGIRLLGYSIGDMPIRAGEALSFSLFWQVLRAPQEPYIVFAQLQDEAGQPVALSETPPVYPSERWTAGILLRDPHQILLPPGLPAAEYHLVVGLLRPDGTRLMTEEGDQVVLARVPTIQRVHHFTPPTPSERYEVAEARFGAYVHLLGYELKATDPISPGENLELVLYWQALQPAPQRYSVFVHLIDTQDHIFGQHDQEPGAGQFPTTSWVSGEYLVDIYKVPVNPDTPAGEYWLEIGLYDPISGQRLEVSDGKGQPIGNRLLLSRSPIRVQ